MNNSKLFKHNKRKPIGEVIEVSKNKKFVKVKFNASEHWKGMPEFVQNDIAAYKKVTVNFTDEEGVRKFFKLINQTYTPKTRSIWFPEVGIDKLQDKRYASKKK